VSSLPWNVLIPALATLVLVAFWLWMFVDMTSNPYLDGRSKYNWMLAFIFLNVVAAIFYFTEYKRRP
jgi:hypothetical protein